MYSSVVLERAHNYFSERTSGQGYTGSIHLKLLIKLCIRIMCMIKSNMLCLSSF